MTKFSFSDRLRVNLRLFLYEASVYKEVHSIYSPILVAPYKARKDFFIGNADPLRKFSAQ